VQHQIYFCNVQTKYLQHTYENRWNTWNICLKHACIAIATHAISRSTFATSRWNTCNIRLKRLKHLKHMLETYVYSHNSIWNIQMKHLKHTSETLET
jgi:hypothetical protein